MRVSGALPSDRESDTSETNTYGSHEEEKEDIEFNPDIVEERFRVDRKKLEKLLQGSDEACEAEELFETIMTKTDTVISWPSKIKIGAKSKKDPYVKVCGKTEAVKEAKDLVMAQLDVKTDRVTLKLDVPHTDHSHIIGKKGLNIQQVMHETDCHIHFPDSNRNNPVEKSNLVSIAGQPPQVERARARIRELVPLCLTFQVPMQVDVTTPLQRHIQERYAVAVHVRHNSTAYSNTVMIRANEIDAKKVKEATRCLMDRLISPNTVPVSLTMEIGAQHHTFVAGSNNNNITLIAQLTDTKITFPEIDPVLHQAKKGPVIITGSIDGVHSAAQKLIGSLPLSLMFDLGYDVEFDTSFINQVMDKFSVLVTTKPKVKQSTKSIIIKGTERRVGDLFEARRCLLNVEFTEPSVPVFIPASYTISELNYSAVNLMGIYPYNANSSVMIKSPPPPLIPPKTLNWSTNDSYVPMPYQCRPIRSTASSVFSRAPSVCSNSTTSTLTSPSESPTRCGSTCTSNRTMSSFFGTERLTEKDAFNVTDRGNNTGISRLQELMSVSLPDEIFIDKSSEPELDSISTHFPRDYDSKKVLANNVMKETCLTQTRVPSDNYVGYGFSHSTPEKLLQEQKKNYHVSNMAVKMENDKHWQKRNATNTSRNFLNSLDGSMFRLSTVNNFCDISEFLNKIGCDKYIELFREQEVDLETFMTLDESDLKQLGVPTFGARRKMMEAIKNAEQLRFSAAPGAERRAILGGNRLMDCSEAIWNSSQINGSN